MANKRVRNTRIIIRLSQRGQNLELQETTTKKQTNMSNLFKVVVTARVSTTDPTEKSTFTTTSKTILLVSCDHQDPNCIEMEYCISAIPTNKQIISKDNIKNLLLTWNIGVMLLQQTLVSSAITPDCSCYHSKQGWHNIPTDPHSSFSWMNLKLNIKSKVYDTRATLLSQSGLHP